MRSENKRIFSKRGWSELRREETARDVMKNIVKKSVVRVRWADYFDRLLNVADDR